MVLGVLGVLGAVAFGVPGNAALRVSGFGRGPVGFRV